MKTICANLECNHVYDNIKAEAIGRKARCKRCNTIFQIVEYIEPAKEAPSEQQSATEPKKKESADVGHHRKF
ncbi:hypothetical protein [Candidatus Electronema sp. PJ]|uniref:hypothetical protein n=1 Tax=Candidatus Electronema sp. PJ TaxID=3401572 RepID=UPI003AA911D5